MVSNLLLEHFNTFEINGILSKYGTIMAVQKLNPIESKATNMGVPNGTRPSTYIRSVKIKKQNNQLCNLMCHNTYIFRDMFEKL